MLYMDRYIQCRVACGEKKLMRYASSKEGKGAIEFRNGD